MFIQGSNSVVVHAHYPTRSQEWNMVFVTCAVNNGIGIDKWPIKKFYFTIIICTLDHRVQPSVFLLVRLPKLDIWVPINLMNFFCNMWDLFRDVTCTRSISNYNHYQAINQSWRSSSFLLDLGLRYVSSTCLALTTPLVASFLILGTL